MNVGVRRVSQEFPEGDLPVGDPRGARRSRRRAPEVLRDENGLVLVEASFIYPVVFAVLALLLYAGDMFYQRSWIEAAVLRYSIEGAAEVGNSAIENISVDNEAGTGVLNLGSLENDPYRFIANGGTDSNAGARASANEASLREEVAPVRASALPRLSRDAKEGPGCVPGTSFIAAVRQLPVTVTLCAMVTPAEAGRIPLGACTPTMTVSSRTGSCPATTIT